MSTREINRTRLKAARLLSAPYSLTRGAEKPAATKSVAPPARTPAAVAAQQVSTTRAAVPTNQKIVLPAPGRNLTTKKSAAKPKARAPKKAPAKSGVREATKPASVAVDWSKPLTKWTVAHLKAELGVRQAKTSDTIHNAGYFIRC